MGAEEIKKKIDELASQQFALAMKDRWDDEDYALDARLDVEIKELERRLKNECN